MQVTETIHELLGKRYVVAENGRPNMDFRTRGQAAKYIAGREKELAKEAAKAAALEAAKARRLAHPVGAAIETLRADTLVRVSQEVDKFVASRAKLLADANNDLDAVAPPPSRFDNRTEYRRKQDRRAGFYAVTRATRLGSPYGPNAKYRYDIDAERVEQYREQSLQAASDQYDAFADKLIGKIGDCDSAELNGTHVWGYSTLTVRKGGEIERWKTQQIINCSVLGKLFNQWPSRKVK